MKFVRCRKEYLLLLVSVLLMYISPPSFFNLPTFELAEKPKDFWGTTLLQMEDLESFINDDNCYDLKRNFFGCLEGLRILIKAKTQHDLEFGIDNAKENRWTPFLHGLKAQISTSQKVKFDSPHKLSLHYREKIQNRVQQWNQLYERMNQNKAFSFSAALSRLAIEFNLNEEISSKDKQIISEALNSYLAFATSPHDHITPFAYIIHDSNKSTDTVHGIGAMIRSVGNHYIVVRTLKGSPAEKEGLKPGDVITHVNGESLKDLPSHIASQAITTAQTKEVVLNVKRGRKKFILSVIKEKVVYKNVDTEDIIKPNGIVKLIRILSFHKANTCAEVEMIVRNSEKENVLGYIIDLRDNPGGLVDEAICMADLFLPSGIKLLEVRSNEFFPYEKGHLIKSYYTKRSQASRKPIITLVNAGSASASEIFAGVMQDLKRGELLGFPTFGKGSVLRGRFLRNNQNSLVLRYQTIGHFYFPSGHTNHVIGLTPDIESNIPKDNPLNEDWRFREKDLISYHLGDELKVLASKVPTQREKVTNSCTTDTGSFLAESRASSIINCYTEKNIAQNPSNSEQ